MSDAKYTPVPTSVKQIGDVTNIDQLDSMDRATKLDARTKLELLAAEARGQTGSDPRGGGWVFVGRPRVVLQLLIDLRDAHQLDVIKLERGVIVGSEGGDVVCFWQGVPIIVRGHTKDDRLYCVRRDQVPDSEMIDRRRAAEMRMNAHVGTLSKLLEN